MIVPEFWAEARRQVRHKRRSITVRRFGWSDESEAAAQAHAEARVQEALDAILAGGQLPRREQLSNYGIEGVPIREQIVSRHGDAVITRNSYGALCLNTPDVLFGDIDFESRPEGCVLPFAANIAFWAAIAVVGGLQWSWLVGAILATASTWGLNALLLARKRRVFADKGGAEARASARVQAFSSTHPDWHLRVYRTPAGLRILAMHDTFAPQDEAVASFFNALHADALYSRMCKVQGCFRARLTAKPWRVGMRRRIRPPVAAWSREQAQRPDRLAWIADYERRAEGFAACRYLHSLGDESRRHPRAEEVRALHDALTRADSTLPLA